MAINDKLLGGATGDAPSSLDPRDHFGTVLYTGTGSAQSINGGKYDAAASFNGSNSIINAGAGGIQATSTVDISFSISLWMKTTATDTIALFNTYGSGSGSYGFSVEFGNPTAGKFRLWTNYGGASNSAESSSTYNDGQWKHVALVKTQGSTLKLYVDASEILSVNINSGSQVGNPLVFGSYTDYSNYEYTGLLDQVRIYDSVLSSSEVTSLYNESYANSFKVNFPTGKTATALYRLNGNANDETGAYDGTATNITWKYGVNFTPDMTWIAERNATESRFIQDAVRGVAETIYPNDTYQQFNEPQCTTSFDAGGFTLGNSNNQNTNGNTYVGWCWNAGGSTATNNDGDVASTVRANTDGMFSIVKHTAPSSEQNYTIGHGLGVKPSFVLLKGTESNGTAWFVWHKDLTQESYYLYLNGTYIESGLTQDTRIWGQQSFTSDVISMRSNYTTLLGEDYISYCWADVDGFQKAGSYIGNGNNHGPMVETGFKPAFIMVKEATGTTNHWYMYDDKRSPTDPRNKVLTANNTDAESTNTSMGMNWYSDGFQPIDTGGGQNRNSSLYIYLAIAAPPETTTPVVADSFNITAYAGTSADQDITMNFGGAKPDFVWIKNRDATYNHALYDSVRGAEKPLSSNTNAAEDSDVGDTYGLKSFNTDGFSLGNNGAMTNTNGNDFISYGWKASGSSEILTGSGSNNDVVASVNDDAGFSIVTYEGTGSSGMKIRHGLSATPAMVIVKKLDLNAAAWMVWVDQGLTDFDYYLNLNTDSAEVDSVGTGFSAAPNANLLTFGTSGIGNDANLRYVAYCWRRISGYSAFGTYTGNNSTNAITGLGFQPDWVLIKCIDTAGTNWQIWDSVRTTGYNLFPNLNIGGVDNSSTFTGFTSTGFTVAGTSQSANASGSTYSYAAFKIN